MILNINGQDFECLFSTYFLGELLDIFKEDIVKMVGDDYTLDNIIGLSNNIEDAEGNIIKTEIVKKGLIVCNPLKYLPLFMYHSIRINAELDDKPFNVTKKHFIDKFANLEVLGSGEGIEFINNLNQCVYGKKSEKLPEENKLELVEKKS